MSRRRGARPRAGGLRRALAPPLRRVLRPSRVADDRGALAVEAALLIPFVLIPLVFGIIETSLLLKDKVTVTSMARNAARVAASSDPNYPPIVAVPGFVSSVAQTVAAAVPELPAGAMQEVWVYRPVPGRNYPAIGTDADPFPAVAGNNPCGTDCLRLVWVQGATPSTGSFRSAIGTWPSGSISTCLPNMDDVGVYVKARHDYFTGLFGGSATVADAAIMRFEPQEIGRCTP